MRILHINGNYIGTRLHQVMIEHLAMQDVVNEVVIPNNGIDKPTLELNANAKIINCFKPMDRFFFYGKQKKIIRAIRKRYQIKKYDIIHAYTLFTDGYSARKIAEKANKPYVVAVRNTDLNIFMKYFPFLRNTGIKTLLEAEKVFFLSNPYYEQMLNYVPENKKAEIRGKSIIIPNGIDDFWINNAVEKPKRMNIGEEKKINLVYVGRIDSNKNIPATINAMNILEAKGYKCSLSIAGNVADETVFSIISNDDRVIYYGSKTKEELIELYRSNDIFVMPSFTESFGLVYAEAMSQGLPVIYSEKQGFDKQFEDGEVGYPIDPHNEQTIADAVIKIIKQYEDISAHCINDIDRFDWKKICQKYKKIYDDVLADERKY